MKLRRLTIFLLISAAWTTCIPAQSLRPVPNEVRKLDGGKTQRKITTTPTLTLRIYDFDQIPPSEIESAKQVASDIFRIAGLQTRWVDCPFQSRCRTDIEGPEFRLRIVPPTLGHEMASDDALGLATPCADDELACIVYIFNWRIHGLASSYHLSPGRLLGHVIAHEIGHQLLGSGAHNPFGIMQHRLPIPETERILFFTPGQAKQLRAELAVRIATGRSQASAGRCSQFHRFIPHERCRDNLCPYARQRRSGECEQCPETQNRFTQITKGELP